MWCYYCVYLTNKRKLVYKLVSYCRLKIGERNNLDQKLIFKAKLTKTTLGFDLYDFRSNL